MEVLRQIGFKASAREASNWNHEMYFTQEKSTLKRLYSPRGTWRLPGS